MKKMTRKYYQTTREPLRNGWTSIRNEFVNCKANGTPDKRCAPIASSREIQIHKNGHKRLYVNNLLKAEKYAKTGGIK
jgi:hypothetical protein|tara:strand:+ start:470 stop:703 length:234 start_codon:yes stop_codon:yes gene_type:complete